MATTQNRLIRVMGVAIFATFAVALCAGQASSQMTTVRVANKGKTEAMPVAIQDDAVYAEHWAGHRPVTVTIEPDRIVIRRAGDEVSNGDGPEDGADE